MLASVNTGHFPISFPVFKSNVSYILQTWYDGGCYGYFIMSKTGGFSHYHWNEESGLLDIVHKPSIIPASVQNRKEQNIQPIGEK
jgi:hypothetical protein